MRTAMRIYKCRCGQFTPVDTSSQAPLCSGCGSRDFTHVLRFQPAGSKAESSWIQSSCPSDGGTSLTSSSDFKPNAEHIPTRHTDDDQDSKLNISRARAQLDYLEMLKRRNEISDEQFQQETQRVLRRVLQRVIRTL